MRMIDSHTHLCFQKPELLLELVKKSGCEKFGVMAIPTECGPLNTLECLLMKRLAPEKIYSFGGMIYTDAFAPTAEDHETQLRLMLEAGCDGWKILESKPAEYKKRQLPLDGEVFARAFALAERENVPVTWHAGDPATFWDAERAPKFAAENGWLCIGEGFPTLQELYRQVESVFAHHPKLCASMAHIYFISDDRAHGERMLDTYENFFMDITPGTEMYQAFMDDREGWRRFFEKYQDKIVYGSDTADTESDPVFNNQDDINALVWKTLANDEPFTIMDASGTGLGLSTAILDKIYCRNFEKRVGAVPKKISESGLNAYVNWLMPRLTKEEQKKAEALLKA